MFGRACLKLVEMCFLVGVTMAAIEFCQHAPVVPQWTPVKAAVADPGFVITNHATEVTESIELPDTFWVVDRSPVPVAPRPVETIQESTVTVTVPSPPAWMKNIFAVQVHGLDTKTGHQVIADGTGVSFEPEWIITCNHLLHDLRNCRAEVQVDGEWKSAYINRIPGANDQSRDWLYLYVEGENFPSIEFREPQYMEPVTVYGLKTGSPRYGIVSASDVASLEIGSVGIQQGDSGGGVFGNDGCYLGTLRGCQEHEPLVARFSSVAPAGQNFASSGDSQIIVFSASWCGPCHQYEATLESLGWPGIQIVDIDSESGKQVMKDLNFTPANVPTTIIVERGKIIKTQVGSITAEQVKQFAGRGPL